MSVLVIRAENAAGRQFELRAEPDDERQARVMAGRVAGLLSAVGDPATWAGSKVAVIDARTRAIVAAVRVVGRRVRV